MALSLDKFRDVDLVIDKANDNFIQRQFVSQADYKGRTLTVQVTNNGEIGEIPGLFLNLRWQNQVSGLTDLTAFVLIDKENSVFRIEYPEHMMTPGKVVASIQLIHDGKTLHMKQFELTVQKLAGEAVGIVGKAEYSALVAVLSDANKFRTDIATLDVIKADKTEVENRISSIGSGVPKRTFKNLTELKTEYPNGANAVMLVLEPDEKTGYIYSWNGKIWEKGVLYQASGFADKTVTPQKLSDSAPAGFNLINPFDVEVGYINGATGEFVSGGTSDGGLNRACQEYIPVIGGEYYTRNSYMNVVFYNSSKQVLTGQTSIGDRAVIQAPVSASYVRVSYKSSDEKIAQFAKGATFLNAEPYFYTQNHLETTRPEISQLLKWRLGVIGSDGRESYMETRICIGGIRLKKGSEIGVVDAQIGVFFYDYTTGEYLNRYYGFGDKLNTIQLDGDYIIRLNLAYLDNSQITNISELSSKLTIKEWHERELEIKSDITSVQTNVDLNARPLNSLVWMYGSIDGNWGSESDVKTRIKSQMSIIEKGTKIRLTSDDIKLQIIRYKLIDKSFETGVVIFTKPKTEWECDEDAYYRVVIAYKNDSIITDIETLRKKVEFVDSAKNEVEKITPITEEIGTYYFSQKMTEFLAHYSSCLCLVKDELWFFMVSDDSGTNRAGVYRYTFDLENKSLTYVGRFLHNWGHVNSVGYSPETDTLVTSSFVGQNTAEVNKEYKIYLFENASQVENDAFIQKTDALAIDVKSENWGWRQNVTFGEGNGGRGNILYYCTDDQTKIRKLLLGQGSNDFGKGQFRSGKTGNQFNGSFKVLSEFIDENKSFEVNQGTSYYAGYLYIALGNDGIWYQITRLNLDGTITKKEIRDVQYGDDGELVGGHAAGIWRINGYTFYLLQIGLENTLFVYQN